MPTKKATVEEAPKVLERYECTEDVRVKGIHFTPGDQVSELHPQLEELLASGAFKKA